MTSDTNPRARKLAAAVAATTIALLPISVAAEPNVYKSLLDKRASALVTVKFVLKTSMPGMMGGMGDQESESEVTGVMIEPKGLVVCSDTQMGGFMRMLTRMMPMMGDEMSATPTDIKVLVGDEAEGREAELIARDSELDLAWVRIKDVGDQSFDYLDLGQSVSTEVGQRIIAVRRMSKYFGRAPSVVEGRIAGSAKKPRDLYIPSVEFAMALGLPVYTEDGRLIGLLITQAPAADDGGGFNPLAMLGQMSNMQEMMAGLVLPAQTAARATKRALASAESEEQE